jgi:nucleoid-associated protein YgaU
MPEMRKDLRYGLGIGALLLAFIVTYLVVRNHTENQHAHAASARPDDAADDSVEGGSAEANPTGMVAAGDAPAPNAAASLPPLAPMPVADPASGRFAGGPAVAADDPFAARKPGRQAKANPIKPTPTRPPTGQDWDRLLAEGWPSAPAAPAPALTRSPAAAATAVRPGTVVPPTSVPTPNRPTTADRSVALDRQARTPVESVAQLRPAALVGSMTSPAALVGGTAAARGTLGTGAVAAKTGRPYTVREGDTFVSIAKAAFGNGKYFLQIEKANPAVDPGRLKIGQQIVLPDLPVEARAAKGGPFDNEADNRPINARTEYRVDTNDSLYRIAMKVYGTPRMIDPIYEANRAAIGGRPEMLRFGMILRLPQSLASN